MKIKCKNSFRGGNTQKNGKKSCVADDFYATSDVFVHSCIKPICTFAARLLFASVPHTGNFKTDFHFIQLLT